MEIREWRYADLGPMIQIGAEMHAESPHYCEIPYDPTCLIELAENARKMPKVITAFLALENDELIGMMIVLIQPFFFSRARHAIDLLLFVKPAFRLTTAAASQLVNASVDWAFDNGAIECRFGETTGVSPELVGKFYQKKGFSQIGTLFRKKLAP